MVLVLFVVSFVIFLIFVVLPGGDPAQRIAGKNATAQNIENIRQSWGFDQNIFVQYRNLMQKTFSGDLVSYDEPAERRATRSSRACPRRSRCPSARASSGCSGASSWG